MMGTVKRKSDNACGVDTEPLMAGRLLKVSSLATVAFASSGFYLHSRQLDLNDLSIIRFGRAAATNECFVDVF
ncbi:unnamed protein product [Pleuronectes platessa]|uniref:Uncharacterized protein n=1 Tax=Pleuronectes platessa TaxID=8262 RepID=A0A9N7UH94_PLEPL|nr:unnamed protein product [Pleuronectes platessa]